MRISWCYIVCSLALAISAAFAQDFEAPLHDRAYFKSLDDVTLQLKADIPEAREVFRERVANYTPEQMEAIHDAYRQALREKQCRDGASSEVLLERISTTEDCEQLMYAHIALRARYAEAEADEQRAIRESYLASWRAMSPPDLAKSEQEIDFDKFFGYLQNLHHYFHLESEALPILEERCIQNGLANGVCHMYQTLFMGPYEVGPLTAARAEAEYMAVFRTGKMIEMNGESAGVLEATLHSLLGKCGPSGLEALQRMGTLKTPTGMAALRYMHTPEAEAILWEILEDPASHPQTKIDVLRVLNDYQYRNPSDERIRRYREPLAGILAAPKDGSNYDLQALEEAVLMAVKIGDSHYRDPILALERSLDPAALQKADLTDSEGLDPEKFPKRYTSDSLRAAIDNAKGVLQ